MGFLVYKSFPVVVFCTRWHSDVTANECINRYINYRMWQRRLKGRLLPEDFKLPNYHLALIITISTFLWDIITPLLPKDPIWKPSSTIKTEQKSTSSSWKCPWILQNQEMSWKYISLGTVTSVNKYYAWRRKPVHRVDIPS